MTIGSCSCEVGKDGSPCKHQYMLWAAKRAKCLNFVPVNSPEDRQKLAKIAIGEALPLSYYTSLKCCQDKSVEKGALDFAQRVKKLASSMHGNLTSALFNFGSNELRKGKNGKKIKVQPNRKRKHANGAIKLLEKVDQ